VARVADKSAKGLLLIVCEGEWTVRRSGSFIRFCEHSSYTVAGQIENTCEMTSAEGKGAIDPSKCLKEEDLSVPGAKLVPGFTSEESANILP
jgi:hypothetical protein